MKNKLIILTLFLGSLIGFSLDRLFFTHLHGESCTSDLHFIKPNLDCDVFDNKIETLSTLRDKLRVSITSFERTGKIKRASVFVRDLKTSRFAGVHDDEIYYMASLLKIPVLIGGFKLAEVEPKILDQEIYYDGKIYLYDEQVIKSPDVLKAGNSYSVKDLMRRSIVYSDNTSAQLLYNYYPDDFMDRIMQALGIQLTNPNGESENLITARTYAGVFRVLYNASYLTKEYSDEALKILTETSFDKGATAEIPKNVIVAHKFAERTVVYQNSKPLKQFHECGIVYAKDSKEPYSFCIMTEGDSYEDLESVVAELSHSVYEEMIKG